MNLKERANQAINLVDRAHALVSSSTHLQRRVKLEVIDLDAIVLIQRNLLNSERLERVTLVVVQLKQLLLAVLDVISVETL